MIVRGPVYGTFWHLNFSHLERLHLIPHARQDIGSTEKVLELGV